ncbi:AI-2E family transporter [Cyanobacterium aponinum UTEX 3222]|uniref:AI-2E family transporter n=1 Tax=Cyanobacterium aponinum AL20115 TaxID=3090662 RepID=A0AAF0Z9Z7_9CHRO|nr:AI-2E family transporter [Cyanobacterium aponinum]WRL43036.1 AI-2E family transporter [Cyanobacterium aponinum UTEX 3222]MBD2394200.1 AI-2E family transporter [Cyanobacterium aponinum FACHB-4101]PHV62512.1 AI-2E family transporter [Cyanobacterium aponinum IPPAS B-1201]WPF87675.1 AI-2E family transporter [Cyanobacterium aponinum AL20115]WRL40140.1 AI-2E family transporter [Cyanobacterium aponinum UTEX 3221]
MNFGQSLGFLAFLISLYILWQIRHLLLLVFSAIIFAVALNRLVKKLENIGWSRYQSVYLTVLSLIAIIFILVLLIFPPFIDQFQLLINALPKVPIKINELIENIAGDNYQVFETFLNNFNKIINDNNLLPAQVINNFIALFSNFLNVTFQVIFVFVLTVVFLLNPLKYRRYLLKVFPAFYRYRIDEILNKTEIAIVNWLGGILINCIFIGVLSGVGLFFLQVKLVLVHALLAGLLNFIPNIGPTLSVVFPITIAVVDSPWQIIPIIVWYFIIQNIESYWLTPKVMADKVSLLPAVTLFAQIFFATVFGLLGLLLALPLTVVVKTWMEEILFKDILDNWQLEEV